MERYIVAAVGGIIALAALFYLIKLLILKFTGIPVKAEVVAVTEPKQGSYVHRLRFEAEGSVVESEDKTGYSQPFSKGEVRDIVCSRRDPKRFEYAQQLNRNIAIAGILLIMAILIVLRFLFFVTDGEIEKDITMRYLPNCEIVEQIA